MKATPRLMSQMVVICNLFVSSFLVCHLRIQAQSNKTGNNEMKSGAWGIKPGQIWGSGGALCPNRVCINASSRLWSPRRPQWRRLARTRDCPKFDAHPRNRPISNTRDRALGMSGLWIILPPWGLAIHSLSFSLAVGSFRRRAAGVKKRRRHVVSTWLKPVGTDLIEIGNQRTVERADARI